MADVEYDVVARLIVEGIGRFKGAMSEASSHAARFAQGVQGMGAGFADFATSAASFAAKATAAVGVASAAAVGAAALGVGKNLSMLEDKAIQLGAVMAAATGTPFDEMRKQSDELFSQFREDAVKSAGETADFVGVAASISGAVMGAGRSMAELRSITQGVIAAAPALGTSFQQAGTDVMRMFQGHAGAELPFFRAMQSIPELGIKSAEAFNKMDMQKRIDVTTKALRNPAFIAAAQAMENTFTGLSSTMLDQAKVLGGAIGGPIFDKLKTGMKGITDMMMPKLKKDSPLLKILGGMGNEIGTTAKMIGQQWGLFLFPDGGGTVERFATMLRSGVEVVMHKISGASQMLKDHWSEIHGFAKAFAQKLDHAYDVAKALVTRLGDGDLGKGLERLGMGAAGAKAASMAAPIVSSGAMAASGAAGMAKSFGLIGGGAGAAEGAGAGGAAASAAGIGASAAAMAVAIVAVLGLAIVDAWEANVIRIRDMFFGSLGFLKDSFSDLWQSFLKLHEALKPILILIGTVFIMLLNGLMIILGGVLEILAKVITALAGLIDWLLHIDVAFRGMWRTLEDFASQTERFGDAARTVGMAVEFFNAAARDFIALGEKLGLIKKKLAAEDDTTKHTEGEVIGGGVSGWIETAQEKRERKAAADAARPKPGGTNVNVTVKIDLSNENEEAVFVRSRGSIKKAFDMAEQDARISTSPLYGVGR